MASRKIFFQLPYNAIGWKAETELIQRLEVVCRRLGHQSFSSCSARDAIDVGADVIFTLHFLSAKVTPIFTAGLVWNPIKFLHAAGPSTFVKTLSLDAHLYAGESLRTYFAGMTSRGFRVTDIGDFYPSAQRTDYEPIGRFGRPVYVGSLWQDDRHEPLFQELNQRRTIDGYGPGRRWAAYPRIYRGSFPIDARSFLETYRRSGIGLCLHSDEHFDDNVPAMRIFEIVASGCVGICDRLPFVEAAFGDSVFYLDRTLSAAAIAGQLDDLVARIQEKPAQAREMARAAHEIFCRRFSLDVLLEQALERIDENLRRARAKTDASAATAPAIQVYTRTQGRRPSLLRRALRSLVAQAHPRIRSTLIYHGSDAIEFLYHEVAQLRSEFPQLDIDCLVVAPSEPLSTTIPASLKQTSAGLIAFLDDDDWIFPEHLETLLATLEAMPGAVLAVSGVVMHSEHALNAETVTAVPSFNEDIGELLSFGPMDVTALKAGNFTVSSNMFLLRGGAPIDWTWWPQLNVGEDRALLALVLENHPAAAFSSRVSCVWSNRQVQGDNQVDRVSEPGFLAPTPLFTYQVPVPTRLRPPIMSQSLFPWPVTGEKCARVNHLLRRNRWIPRWARPFSYQREFDALLLSMVEDWIENRLAVLPGGLDLAHLRELSGEGFLSPRRAEFDRGIRQILAVREPKLKSASGRHGINLETAHAFERFFKL